MRKTSQSSQAKKSNRLAGREAAQRVRLLIDKCAAMGGLPVKNGALWHAEIKRQAKLSNGQIDGNSEIKAMLEAYAGLHGVQYSRRGRVAPEEDTGPVALSCRPRCSFKPSSVPKRLGFSSPVLNGGSGFSAAPQGN